MPNRNSKTIEHTQDHELSHSMAHYLLTVHKLKEERGYARVTDIARELNLTKGSVSTAVNGLKKRELLVEEDDTKFLDLSKRGHKEVHQILSTRTIFYYFFVDVLGVDSENAKKDSCLIEHLIGGKTRLKLFDYLKGLCEENKQLGIDFSQYESLEDFSENQKGDSFLDHDHDHE